MPNTHTPARSSPVRKPTPATSGREPTGPTPKPTKSQNHSTLRITLASPPAKIKQTPLNPPQTESKPRTIRNQNQNKEPKSELQPPRPKLCLSPPKATHPPPPQKKTYNHPTLQTTPRTHKTLDTQGVHSSGSEMTPLCQFKRALSPPGPGASEYTIQESRQHTHQDLARAPTLGRRPPGSPKASQAATRRHPREPPTKVHSRWGTQPLALDPNQL
ncbi:hypothetical protein CRENBAI_001896 [Crenichthys baileyi]|uniref:Extensin-like n=1 Tax=Crenichthys baileyi TaxID=28760 RepID=A0AAV9SMN7_9TELE